MFLKKVSLDVIVEACKQLTQIIFRNYIHESGQFLSL